ncbi:EthD family reductase [Pseudonocardia bannensis]|uniref:EthD family reductase n=1 Tax=Pseudonocardia bannensis TaxID=630973 RepID=A0A848DG67_9PSEU|nr:EthD family reductase [Pseudonocardia bannensis]NMH91555.1 EthD family reductase [Pseudonocardia bannensis]
MIKVSVLYPRDESAKFDMDYYLGQHIPMVQEKLGAALKGVSVEQGVAGGTPDAPPAFVAMGHLLFDSPEAFQESFGPHAEQIMGDIPNYTSIQPTIQISDVKM